jgi:hypothetical protein
MSMIVEMKNKNNNIKTLRQKLRQTPNRTSMLELDLMLASIADRKAFILLLDTFETEKEITRDLLEALIDHSFDMNSDIIDYLENEITLSKGFTDMFTTKNIKSIVLLAIAIGIVIAVASNDKLASFAVNSALETKKEGAK